MTIHIVSRGVPSARGFGGIAMAARIARLEVSEQQRHELSHRAGATSAQREVRRARIVLMRAEGPAGGHRRATGKTTVVGLSGATLFANAASKGSSAMPRAGAQAVASRRRPSSGWSHEAYTAAGGHALERAQHGAGDGVSRPQVQRIWSANDIKPHLMRTFKLSQRPAVRGQVLGRHRALPRSAGQGAGAVLRREEPVPGARPHPAGAAAGERPHPHQDARLHSATAP